MPGTYSVGRIMARVPDSLTYSVNDLAGYINQNFMDEKDKTRAIFTWITRNIRYNFDSLFSIRDYPPPEEISERVLQTRVGVCLHFASLFCELANQAGIKAYVIQGYTRQNRVVDYLPHVWCAGFIDSTWYLFDPTWGSGYYRVHPEDLIRSHMPFDPMWQFLEHPLTCKEFYENNYRERWKRPVFHYTDTLRDYELASEMERNVSAARRIEQDGDCNSFTAAKHLVLQGNIEYLRNKSNAEKYDSAVDLYNQAIRRLNKVIEYGNRQYQPEADFAAMRLALDTVELLLTRTGITLSGIRDPIENAVVSIAGLQASIAGTWQVLVEQRAALQGHFRRND